MKNLRGSFTAIVTPMNEGEVDYKSLEKLIEFQIVGNIDGIVVCGTTGESATLSLREHECVMQYVIERVNDRMPVIAGVGANSTQEAVLLTHIAQNLGVDAGLSVLPYYNNPSQSGIEEHFLAIANVGLPIILYDVPSCTVVKALPETVARLAEHENIIGIKAASGDVRQISQIIKSCPQDFSVLSGDDFSCLATMAIGCRGVISVVSNIVPREVSIMIEYALTGQFAEARAMYYNLRGLMDAIFCYPSPAPVKEALSFMNIITSLEVRLPMNDMDEQSRAQLIIEMKGFGLL